MLYVSGVLNAMASASVRHLSTPHQHTGSCTKASYIYFQKRLRSPNTRRQPTSSYKHARPGML